ncbi:hypothetical protein BC2230_30771 [Burkholderia cepacia]
MQYAGLAAFWWFHMTMSARIVNDSSARVRRLQAGPQTGRKRPGRSWPPDLESRSTNRPDFTAVATGIHTFMSAAAGPCDALSPACSKKAS